MYNDFGIKFLIDFMLYIYNKKNSIYLRIITHGSVSVGKFSITYGLLPTNLYL